MTKPSIADIVERCQGLFEDLNFTAARRWKEAEPGRKVIGYMPVYVPREIIHAAGMLPLGVLGGGDQLEVIHGDAYYQSYICRIPRRQSNSVYRGASTSSMACCFRQSVTSSAISPACG